MRPVYPLKGETENRLDSSSYSIVKVHLDYIVDFCKKQMCDSVFFK